MAQQDDIIIINTVKTITTSILDYFFNICLVTEITEDDLLTGKKFDTSDMETYSSLKGLAEVFKSDSKIYKTGQAVFNQKTNNGVNQSNVRRLVVVRKLETDETFQDALNRVGYINSYFVLVNPSANSESLDIQSVNEWVSGYRKMLFAQTTSSDVVSSSTSDVASALKNKHAGRCALYYHELPESPDSQSEDPKYLYENLAGAMASIMSHSPIGRYTASYKTPSGITVDKLSASAESYLDAKNVNYYVPFIGGAGEYGTREMTSANGVTSEGIEIQETIAIDRIVLTLQAGLMDALQMDIPYDDRGGTIVYEKVNGVFSQLKREGIFAEDSIDDETGEKIPSYSINVLTRATVKKHFPDYFAQKMFIVECEVQLAGSGKK